MKFIWFHTYRIGQGKKVFLKAIRLDSILEVSEAHVNLNAGSDLCDPVLEITYKGTYSEKTLFTENNFNSVLDRILRSCE